MRKGRTARMRATRQNTVSAVSSVRDQLLPRPAAAFCDDDCRTSLVGRAAAGADDTDANAAFSGGSPPSPDALETFSWPGRAGRDVGGQGA